MNTLPSYLDEAHLLRSTEEAEYHPLKPFLPADGKVLFLGSFPPPRKRWCVDFFYPNYLNDHWRIEGLVFFGDRNRFVNEEEKTFRLPEIVSFLEEKGIGFYDTATAVRRQKDNASDLFLEILEQTDIPLLLRQMPLCRIIATTGEKATSTLCQALSLESMPGVGHFVPIPAQKGIPEGLLLYRLPSSSRAYPLSLFKKTEMYAQMFRLAGILP